MPDRAPALAAAFAVLIAALLARLFQLQVLQGDTLANAVEVSRVVTELLPAPRGRILDRHGEMIAGNRAAYDLAVVMGELELGYRQRRLVPFFRLDERRMDALVADLGVRLEQGHAQVVEAVLRELVDHPGVAIRSGSEERDTALALLAIPRLALAPSPMAELGSDGTPAEERAAAADEAEDGAAVLAQSDLITDDPREALARETERRWGGAAELLTPQEFAAAAILLGRDSGVAAERCATVLEAFAPLVAIDLPEAPGAAPTRLQWRLLSAERRPAAEAALARFLGQEPQQVHERLDRALAGARRPAVPGDRYFAAATDAEEIAGLMPDGQGFEEVTVSGVPAARERIFIIQGDLPGVPGLFARLQERLGASLGAPADRVGALIERHAERIRATKAERDHRLHQMALDPQRLDRLCGGLAAELTRLGQPTSRLEIERRLAEARRIADREHRGQGRNDPIVIIRDVPHRLAVVFEGASAIVPGDLARRYDETEPPLPGLVVHLNAGRHYRFPGSSSHLIGSLGRVSAVHDPRAALALGVDPDGWQGRSGFEATYDTVLRGIVGTRTRMRSANGWREVPGEPAIPGQDLRLEVDMELQLIAEDGLARWFQLAQDMGTATDEMSKARSVGHGRSGFVMIDCQTGGLLCLASAPGYKLEEVGQRYQELNDPVISPGQPLHDYASEASQPPGSVVKILTALACLEGKVMTPGEEIYSPGYMMRTRGGDYILRSHAPAGSYNLRRAIQYSDNVYFATIGGRLGGERLSAFYDLFGMGRKNAADVSQQRGGILPRPATIAQLRKAEPKWMAADTWRMAIGQFMSSSPLQMVTIAAAVGNGGHLVTPHLVKPVGAPEVKDLHIRKDHLEEVRRGMELVTDNREGSTAKYLQLEGAAAGIKVAAKTGTSEWGSRSSRESGRTPDHAWLIGYAPADNPTIAFAIFIHSGTSGGRACSPVARKVLEAYFAKFGRNGHARLLE